MAGADEGETLGFQGHQEAHTPGEKSGGSALDDPGELFDPLPLFDGPVAHVANTLRANPGRGRPKGSANKRTVQMRDTLLKMGFQHPMMNLAALANANASELSAELSCDKLDAMKLIQRANEELLPYFESKRPLEVDVRETRLGVLVVGELSAGTPGHGEYLSLTGEVAEAEPDQ